MPKTQNNIRINKYLDGEMTPEEEIIFEKDLKTDTRLQQELQLHLQLDKVIENRESDIKYRQYLGKFRKNKRPGKDFSFTGSKTFLAIISASFIILITVVLFLIYSGPHNSPEIFAQYYLPYDLDNNYRSAGESDMDQGLNLYNNKKYGEALVYFENLLKAEPYNAKAHFAAGISALEVGQNKQAAEHFIQVMESENLEFYQHAQWYLALTYLRLNKVQEAEILLIALRNTGGFYHKQASEIVDTLR